MTIRVGARRFTHHEFIADRDELELWLGPPRLLARPRLASTPEGHELGYDEDGELVALRIVRARATAGDSGLVPVHDEDGNFLGAADVTDVIAFRS